MADVKKKSGKKPDKKGDKKAEAPASKTGHDVMWELVGFFLAIVILISAVTRFPVLDYLIASPNNGNSSTDQAVSGDYSFWDNLINNKGDVSLLGTGDLFLGKEIKDKGLTQVRREPGGSVIGLQKRGEVAKIVDGPIVAYGVRWWMADYSNPPSGWVDEQDITTKFFSYYVVNFFPIMWDYIKLIGWILSAFLILIIIYYFIKESNVPIYDDEEIQTEDLNQISISSVMPINTKEAPPLNLPVGLGAEDYVPEEKENTRWNHIELLLKSHNSSDWRQAVIEADVMLEDMLDKMGYPGVSIGDKLKNIEEGDFTTLDKAWEAHKVRNRIAHDGGEYKLPYDEVARVIGLYYDVFKEFYWV
jgi:hypothetical protein